MPADIILGLAEEDQTGARATEGLVRRGGDDIAVLEGVRGLLQGTERAQKVRRAATE